jgi:hypothetical protein
VLEVAQEIAKYFGMGPERVIHVKDRWAGHVKYEHFSNACFGYGKLPLCPQYLQAARSGSIQQPASCLWSVLSESTSHAAATQLTTGCVTLQGVQRPPLLHRLLQAG